MKNMAILIGYSVLFCSFNFTENTNRFKRTTEYEKFILGRFIELSGEKVKLIKISNLDKLPYTIDLENPQCESVKSYNIKSRGKKIDLYFTVWLTQRSEIITVYCQEYNSKRNSYFEELIYLINEEFMKR